jgi:hypothetical protein
VRVIIVDKVEYIERKGIEIERIDE